MKSFCSALVIFWSAAVSFAQIDVRCGLQNEEVLLFEPVQLTVQIVNNTGLDLSFDGTNANAILEFDIEQTPGLAQPEIESLTALLPGGLFIPSRKTVARRVNLLNAYELRQAGPYGIRARVEWGGKAFLSPKVLLDIVPGIEIDRLVAGVPGGQGMRTCTLRTQRREKTEHLFIRIEDEDAGQCFGVYDLGSIVRLYKPVLKMDAAGDIHVLHQSGPWRYTHCVFQANGVPVSRKHYTADLNSIKLVEKEDGRLGVKGGSSADGGADLSPADRIPEFPQKDLSKPVD